MTPFSRPSFLPDELIAEVLSFLDVKSIMRFKCVCKFWNTLFSDPTFVKLHLKKSLKRNTHFLLITDHKTFIPGELPYGRDDETECEVGVIPYSIRTLLDNPSFTISVDSHYLLEDTRGSITPEFAGSCNGLICLVYSSMIMDYSEFSLRLWNPATRTTSPKFGFVRLFRNPSAFPSAFDGHYTFTFGYDNSTDTYKAVATRYHRRNLRNEVKILSMGDNVWRDIQSFPIDPLHLGSASKITGVYFKNNINWLGIQNKQSYDLGTETYHLYHPRNWLDIIKDITTVKQFVIVSLDLGTETYHLYQLPNAFDEVPPSKPNVGVLGDCLSFSYCYRETHFIIWQMKKFGVQDSWTQFLKISYHNLHIRYHYSDENFNIVPLFLSENGETLILNCNQEVSQDILYNWRNNTVVRTNITARKTISDVRTVDNASCAPQNYFESLVSVF
ncbi:F-box/kelch-repeat protein At3g23880-like [Vicia villosa]|uniref:F-box/kelch-repeat protein At3g23880-like n=1 Tax=Vicia villosa TaxID=3911 RepID=UPI00273CC856|nr:F-box/kelch-repeat protein At3g23880-like [Vicia villosa]